MTSKLTIRTFTGAGFSHSHTFPQLVIALWGGAENFTDRGDGRIGPGQGIVFPAGCMHRCVPDDQSRFLVADLTALPGALQDLAHPIVSVPPPLQAFCLFVGQQFEHRLNPELEKGISALFTQLLDEVEFLPQIDPRIARVLERFEQDVSISAELPELASVATLSVSQFKKLFKRETGMTPGRYLLRLRMDKARALLAHTDFPVGMVAEMVGYGDTSAFSRSFQRYHGHSPRHARKR